MNLNNFFFSFENLLFRSDFFFVSFLVLYVGFCGILVVKESLILILISLELVFIAIILNLVLFSCWFNDLFGYFFTIVLLTVVAVESSVSLAILVMYFRLTGVTNVDLINNLKG